MKIILRIFQITFLIAFLLGISFLYQKVHASQEELNYNVETTDIASYQFDEEITKLLSSADYQLLVGTTKSYLIKNELVETINYKVNAFKVFNEKLYFLVNNRIFIKDGNNFISNNLESGIIYNDFYLTNDAIYLCGNFNNDAYVGIYSHNFTKLSTICLGGEGIEEFVNIYPYQEGFYLVGQKDSISHLSPFKNVGLINTKKVFMIYLEDEEIISEIYFDSSDDSETFEKIIYQKDLITILLSTGKVYQLDYELQINPIINYQMKARSFVLTNKENLVLLGIDNNKLVVNDQILDNCLLDNQTFFQSIEKGNLIVFTKKANQYKKIKISEYHLLKNEVLICDRYNYDLTSLNNLQIVSFFEELTKTIKEYEPLFIKQLDGEYKLKYQIIKEDETSFLLDGKMLVKPFVNIVDNGIYALNKELIFFGNAVLNGQEIFNGYKITTAGVYELVLTNANGQKTSYNFTVIDQYYKEDLVVTFESDYEVFINETITLQLVLNKAVDVKKIIINNQEYDNFTVLDNIVYLKITGKSFYSIDTYQINKIIYHHDNYQELIINQTFTIKTLRPAPKINLYQETTKNKIILKYQIADQNQSSFYLKTEIYDQNNLIGSYQNYFTKDLTTYKLASVPKNPLIRHYLVWHNGNSLQSKLLCEYQSTSSNINDFLLIESSVDLSLTELIITLDANETTFSKLNVENTNLLEKIEISTSKIEPSKIIIICGILVFLTFCYLFIKLKKKKVKNTK